MRVPVVGVETSLQLHQTTVLIGLDVALQGGAFGNDNVALFVCAVAVAVDQNGTAPVDTGRGIILRSEVQNRMVII